MKVRSACLTAVAVVFVSGVWVSAQQLAEPIQPIPPAKVANPAMVELGKKLYFDPRLSKSGFISCNSCHNLSMGGTDNLVSSIGAGVQGSTTAAVGVHPLTGSGEFAG